MSVEFKIGFLYKPSHLICMVPSGSSGNRFRNCHRYEPTAPHTPPSIRLSNRQQQIGKISKAFTREAKKLNVAFSVKK
jgi:hypothetical protein